MLVDIDMLSPFPDQFLVERPDYTFVVGVEISMATSFLLSF